METGCGITGIISTTSPVLQLESDTSDNPSVISNLSSAPTIVMVPLYHNSNSGATGPAYVQNHKG
ncbi:MAG: hypothetical protein IPO92_10780 [Saprospiraceae bacterium]|nr:hypothetical protein [Saprospiraceae bacterium]